MIEIFAGLFYLFTQAEKKIAISGVLIFANREKKRTIFTGVNVREFNKKKNF